MIATPTLSILLLIHPGPLSSPLHPAPNPRVEKIAVAFDTFGGAGNNRRARALPGARLVTKGRMRLLALRDTTSSNPVISTWEPDRRPQLKLFAPAAHLHRYKVY